MRKRRLGGRAFFWLVDNVMVGLFYVTSALTLLPATMVYAMIRALAALLFYARRRARRNLLENISKAMPEITDRRELNRIGRGTYSSLLFPMADLLYFKRHKQRFVRGFRVQGLDNLENAEAQGKGVIGLLVHHGGYLHKMIFVWVLNKPFMGIAVDPKTGIAVPRYYGKLLSTSFGLQQGLEEMFIWVGEGFDTKKDVRDALIAGNRVWIACDVGGKRVVEFLGHPAALADGVAHWALDTGAPIVPITLLRTRRPYENLMVINEPLSYELTGDRKADVAIIMQAVARGMEDIVRLAPEQWMSWFGLRKWWADAG